MSGNRVLVELLDTVWNRFDRYRMIALSDQTSDRTSGAPHLEMAEAILNGDSEKARQLTLKHLEPLLWADRWDQLPVPKSH
jgi:DNA-binding GntR family transcriptional regulator